MKMVGLVGYAPTTPAMSMQYSTIELQSQIKTGYYSNLIFDQINIVYVSNFLKISFIQKVKYIFYLGDISFLENFLIV